jgi:hypothetical protein
VRSLIDCHRNVKSTRPVERFIRAHYAFDIALLHDYERYATDVIGNTRVTSMHFMRVKNYKPRSGSRST